MKRIITALLLTLLFLSALLGTLAAGPNGALSIQLYSWAQGTYTPAEADVVLLTLNGEPLEGDVPAMILGDRTLAPVRLVGEALADEVLWVQETGQVLVRKGGSEIVLTADDSTALVDGAAQELPGGVPAQVVQYEGVDRVMIPLRFVTETLGASVDWDQKTYTARLTADLEPPPEPEAWVTDVRAGAGAQTVDLTVSPMTDYRITDLGDRVAVDLLGAALESGFPGQSIVAGEQLAGVRYAQHGPELYDGYDYTVRVVLDLQPGTSYQENVQVEVRSDGLRLTVRPSEGQTGFVFVPPRRPETFLVAIDPGHGGSYSGAHYEGVSEKEIDLAVSLKLEALLESLGYQVVMTRSTDVAMELDERADLANAAGADLFVSIHSNAADGWPDYQGIFTYYHPSSSLGAILAQAVQTPLCQITGGIDRGIQSADFVVLRETDMCAVLVEMGFMSNSQELNRLLDGAYQDKLAQGIAQGIIRYLNALA